MRRLIASAILVADMAISAQLMLSDALIYFTWGPVQLGLYLLALAVAGRAAWGRLSWALLWVVLAALAMFPFGVMMRVYGFVDLLAFYYHLQEGITAGSLSDAFRPMIVVGGALAVFVAATYHLMHLLRLGRWVVLAAAAVLLAINPVAAALWSAFQVSVHPLNIAARMQPPQLRDPPEKPDVVVIYMEGLEQGYGNRAVFGDVYAALDALAPEAMRFANIDQIEGTSWSMAGIVASHCGVPLLPNKFMARNMFGAQSDFLTGQTCLSDVLAARGYRTAFYLGAEAAFAGTGNFLASHSYSAVVDVDALRQRYSPEEMAAAWSVWLVDDQMIYDAARADYDAQIGSDQPLAMVIETFGPHGPDHLLARECGDSGQAVRLDDMRPVVKCLADQTLAFLRHVQSQRARRGRDTVFLLVSDHLNHDRRLRRWLDQDSRRNTVMIVGPTGGGTVVDKHGSMIDVYPTLLDYLGLLQGDRAGLGVSLLADAPTLIAEFGKGRLNDQLRYDEAIRNAVWAAPAP